MARNTSRTTVHLQLEDELLAKVDALAKKQARSRLNLIRWTLLCELERHNDDVSRTPERTEQASA